MVTAVIVGKDGQEYPCVLAGFGVVKCGLCQGVLSRIGRDVIVGLTCLGCFAEVVRIERSGDPKFEGSYLPG